MHSRADSNSGWRRAQRRRPRSRVRTNDGCGRVTCPGSWKDLLKFGARKPRDMVPRSFSSLTIRHSASNFGENAF